MQYENAKAVCEVALGEAWRVRPDGRLISELGNWFNFIAGLGLVREVGGELQSDDELANDALQLGRERAGIAGSSVAVMG